MSQNAPASSDARGGSGHAAVVLEFAELATMIPQAAEKVKRHRESCIRLSSYACDIIGVITTEIESMKEDLSDMFRSNLARLKDVLVGILDFLRAQGQGSFLTAVMHIGHDKVADTIRDFRRALEEELDTFVFQSHNSAKEELNLLRWHKRLHRRLRKEQRRRDKGVEVGQSDGSRMSSTDSLSTALPPPPRVFFGRDRETQVLLERINGDSSSRIAILGMGGVGKTSLVLYLLHHPDIAKVFHERRYFVPCESATSLDNLLSLIAAHVGVSGTRNTQSRIIAGLSEAKSIIVLDNLECAWEPMTSRGRVEAFLSLLCGIGSLTLLITMRGTELPEGVPWSKPFLPPISTLPKHAALQTLMSISDIANDDPNIQTLLDLLDNLPLAVTLVGSISQYESTASILLRWEREQTSMLTRGAAHRLSSLDVSIEISISSSRMCSSPESVILLGLLSLLPDGIAEQDFRAVTLAFEKPAVALSALLRTALVFYDDYRIRVLHPIRLYVLKAHSPFNSPRLIDSLFDHFVSVADAAAKLQNAHKAKALERVRKEIGNIGFILGQCLQAKYRTGATIPASCRLIPLQEAGLFVPLLSKEALAAALDTQQPDLIGQALRAFTMDCTAEAIEYPQRIAKLTEAFGLLQQAGNVPEQIECLLKMADWMNWPDKRTKLELALALSASQSDLSLKVRCLERLGIMYQRHCLDQDRAMTFFTEALAISRKLGVNYLQAYLVGRIADTRLDRMQYRLASRDLAEGMTIAEGLADNFLRKVYTNMKSRCLLMQGDVPGALKLAEQSVSIARKTGQTNELVAVLPELVEACLAADDVGRAAVAAEEALQLVKRQGYTWAWGEGLSLSYLGVVASFRGEHASAVAYQKQAQALHRQRGYSQHEGSVIRRLAAAYCSQGSFRAAKTACITALTLSRQNKLVEASCSCLNTLADILIAEGEVQSGLAIAKAVATAWEVAGAKREWAGSLVRIADIQLRLGQPRELVQVSVRKASQLYSECHDQLGFKCCLSRLESVLETDGF